MGFVAVIGAGNKSSRFFPEFRFVEKEMSDKGSLLGGELPAPSPSKALSSSTTKPVAGGGGGDSRRSISKFTIQ
jgi:hypothetical protein